jgi:O-glycosyl hydrolase
MTPWVTSSSDDLASKSAVSVSGSRFTFPLGAQSVTSLVGKP